MLCCLSTLSIQRSKHPMHSIVYAMLFVDTKIKACNAYVEAVNTKHIHTFLPIIFSTFNQFSIRKKFWKAETEGFSTISSILYMLILSTQYKDL